MNDLNDDIAWDISSITGEESSTETTDSTEP